MYAIRKMCIRDSLESCLNEVEVVFSAVGTPPDEDGSADLSYVLEAVSYTHLDVYKRQIDSLPPPFEESSDNDSR